MFRHFMLIGVLTFSAVSYANTVTTGFAKLKSLEGTWVATDEVEGEIETHYEVVSSDHAILERFMGMITIYHLDGDAILATHHCSAGNSPRLKATAESISTDSLRFDFLDIANGSENSGHINGVRFEFIDGETMRQHWSYKDGDEESAFSIEMKRKK